MNRAERRKKARELISLGSGARQVVLTENDIRKIKEEARMTATDSLIGAMMAIPLKVIHDHYHWNDGLLQQFANYVIDEYQEFSDGNVELDEYQKMVTELTGVEFVQGE